MADKTGIEWTDATWNPLRGCTAVSPGCDHCYAASVALRFSGQGQPYEGLAVKGEDGHPQWTGEIMLVPAHLTDPLRWQRPRKIFVNSMSDLFHPSVPIGYIDQVFVVMAKAQRHTFQILTKRPQIMANYLNDPATPERIAKAGDVLERMHLYGKEGDHRLAPWPLPNVWCGTSVEDQRATSRVKALVRCPAAVRFLSCEPLIGPVDLSPYLSDLHWVISGGESGRYHRPLDLDWVRTIRDQCLGAGIAYYHKQHGGLTPKSQGKELDGQEWCQFPQVAA
jgi:protein gp37